MNLKILINIKKINLINDIIIYFSLLSLLFFYFLIEIKFPFTNYAFARPYTLILLIFLLGFYKDIFINIVKQHKTPLLLFFIFIFLNLISLVFNYSGIKSLEGFFHITIPSLIFLICLVLFYKKENFDKFIRLLILLSIILFLINLIFLFKPNTYKNLYAHAQSYPRLGSLFQHPIGYGVFSVILYLILLSNFYNFYNKLFYYLLIFINSLGLVMSGGKVSFVLFLVFSIFIFYKIFLKNKDFKNLFIHLIILLFIVFLFYLFWLSTKNLILSKVSLISTQNIEFSNWIENFYTFNTYKETSVNRRIEIWQIVLDYNFKNFKNFIIGYGPFAFGKILEKDYIHTHNLFFEFFLSYGLLGFIYLLILIFLIYKKLSLAKNLTLNLIFYYYFIHSFFDVLFWGGVLDLIFFTFLSYLIYYPYND